MIRAAAAVVVRPSLWWTALRQYRRAVPGRWWSRRPFLPVPAAEYVAFRLVTQYGTNDRAPEPLDVVNYLAWCRQWERTG